MPITPLEFSALPVAGVHESARCCFEKLRLRALRCLDIDCRHQVRLVDLEALDELDRRECDRERQLLGNIDII